MSAVKQSSSGGSGVAIIPASPFAAAELLPAEVWNAISILLRNAK